MLEDAQIGHFKKCVTSFLGATCITMSETRHMFLKGVFEIGRVRSMRRGVHWRISC